ncbi:type II toxin-antitoxin system RelE/ParE family toxin [Trinickia acidisoli]|uniref:type II toxin-antitoxin system RelE/ParE family toxin n=1 Tax=Trinickia acidisoli TaxID=2767482 RepID=UPI001A8FE2B1|nr:type II toxin-antitoxin system RelE/ParE family toxin [Trinickia acidisoli]
MRVDFAESFGERLGILEAFMLAQDADSAYTRIEHLQDEVLQFVDLVKLHPKIGRPAGVLAANSIEGQWRLERVLRFAVDAGVPELREYVIHAHLVLYAHSDSRVLMLSIRHQRELGYVQEASSRHVPI